MKTALPYASRVLSRTPLASGVWQLRLSLPEHDIEGLADWHFAAGQYVHLGLPASGAEPRPYSIASGAARDHIDLHIRDTGHGLSHAVAQLQTGDRVQVSAAQGHGLPQQAAGRPLLLVAGGVGIAPVNSMLDDENLFTRPVHLFWGVEDEDHLYLDDRLRDLAVRQPFFYHPLVRELPGPALAAILPDLAGFAVYMAGPAAMVAATLPQLEALAAEKAYIFGDGITL